MNCLIVEDEPLAASVLEDFIHQTPSLKLVGKCPDAHFALEAMRLQSVDVLFLDIQLPGLKGLDFLRSLPQPPQTILTTAFDEFALAGYELGVVDYLLKPIDFDRFLKAVGKLRRLDFGQKPSRPFRFFNVNKKMVRVWLDEITVVESLKEYAQIHLTDGRRLVTKISMNSLESLLDSSQFLRVHRSFLVSLAQISAFSASEITVSGKSIPIGRLYKEAVGERFSQFLAPDF